MEKVKDIRIIFLYIIVVIMLLIGFTYAISEKNLALTINTAQIEIDESAYGETTFNTNNLDFRPILDTDVETLANNVIKIDFMVGGASTNNTDNIIYDIALNDLSVNCELLSPYIKWKLIKNGTELSNGSLDYKFDTIVNGRMVLTPTQQDLAGYSASKTGYDSYTFYMWFSDSCQDANISKCIGKYDQSALLGKQLSGKIEVELYTNSKTTLVRNPSDSLSESTCTQTNSYTIAYNLNGGRSGANAPTSGNHDAILTIDTPMKTIVATGNDNGTGATIGGNTSKSQTFTGWTASNIDTSTAYYGTSSSTVTTLWSDASTKVNAKYFKNLASTNGTIVTLTANWEPAALNLPTVTKSGYTCKWNTASNGSGTSYDSGASYTPSVNSPTTITMYAVCTANTYSLSYTLNGGTKGSNAPTSATYDNVLTINNPTKTITVTGDANGTGASVGTDTSATQTFAGWTATSLNTSTAYYGTSSGSVTTAWSNASTKVTAQYFKNLTATNGTTVTLKANWTAVTLTLPTVTKSGYTCKWNTASNGSGTEYSSGGSYTPSTTDTTSITMYAVCTANTYNISYNLNGGTKGSNAPDTGSYDNIVTINNPTKTVTVTGDANGTGASVGTTTSSSQTFAGWTASNIDTSIAYYGTSSSSVTTAWSDASTKVTAQYFKNLTSASGTTVTLTANWTAVALTLPTITKSGYICKWNTASDGSGTTYNSGASYTPSDTSSSSVTMYAVCTADTLTISSSVISVTQTSPCNSSYSYGYKWQFTMSRSDISSGKMCLSTDNSSYTESYCGTYPTTASTGAGCAQFSSATVWSYHRSNGCIWAQATTSTSVTARKLQCL